MRGRSPLTLIILLLFGCFVVGLLTTLWRSRPVSETATPTQPLTAASPTPGADRLAILFLGVDQFEDPQLLAVWPGEVDFAARAITVWGVPLDYVRPGDRSPISSRFALTEGGAPASSFLEALTPWLGDSSRPAIVILDKEAFRALVDFLGGARIEGNMLDGEEALGALALLEEQPRPYLSLQLEILEALLDQAANLGRMDELTPLTSLYPAHVIVTQPMPELLSTAALFLPLSAENVSLELITP